MIAKNLGNPPWPRQRQNELSMRRHVLYLRNQPDRVRAFPKSKDGTFTLEANLLESVNSMTFLSFHDLVHIGQNHLLTLRRHAKSM